MRRARLGFIIAILVLSVRICASQAMPETAGETLSGKPIVLAKALHGHAAVLIAGFSREGGAGTGDWVKSIHTDAAFNGVDVYQIAMLAGAPSLLRGMIRSSMKKGLSPAQQVNFVVLTEDEKLWRAYFHVSADDQPYVLLIDDEGKVLWHGHGPAASLEPQLKGALH
jgi:hypothetical protein